MQHSILNRFAREESGQQIIETALVSAMLVVALLAAIYSTGGSLTQLYERVVTVIRDDGAISKETR